VGACSPSPNQPTALPDCHQTASGHTRLQRQQRQGMVAQGIFPSRKKFCDFAHPTNPTEKSALLIVMR